MPTKKFHYKNTKSNKKPKIRRYGSAIPNSLLQKVIKSTYEPGEWNIVEDHGKIYHLDKDLSTDLVKVYYNKDGHAIVSHRPTHNVKDALADVGLALGHRGERHTAAWETQTKAMQKYGSENTTIVGYSLGADVAFSHPDSDKAKELITVSRPIVPLDVLKGTKKHKKHVDISSALDAVSFLKYLQENDPQHKILKPESYNIFKEHQAKNVLPRISEEEMIGFGKKKMKKEDLKYFIKKNRKGRGISHKYNVSNKTKKELHNMAIKLVNEINKI